MTVIGISEYIDGEMYASFDVTEVGQQYHWEPFDFWYGQRIEDSRPIGRTATKADTNLVRAGNCGLPRDWESYIYAWRASLEAPAALAESDEMRAFLAASSATFHYLGRRFANTSLADLIRTRPLPDLAAEGERIPAIDMFVKNFFEGQPLPNTFIIPIRLIAQHQFGVSVEAGDTRALQHLRTKIGPKDRVTIRIGLRGLHKRPVV